MTTTLEPRPGTYNCPGQGCDEREQCLRYLRPAAMTHQKWASFDVEKRRFGGTCPSRLWFFMAEEK